MKKGWQIMTLGEIGKISMCKRIFKEETTATGDIPFYKIGTFGKEPDAFIPNKTYNEYKAKYSFPKKGDVLISAAGTIGRRVRYDGEPAYFQDSNIVWIDNDEEQVLNDYLFHFYDACEWNSTKGATISRLYNDDLRRIAIGFPMSLQEQQRIVGLLDEAFGGLATAQAHAAQNLQNARDLFESHLNAVFTQRGEGWQMVRLEDLTELARGHNPPKSKFSREDKPGYVRFYQIRDGSTDEYAVYVPDTPQLHKMKKDDIMMVAYRHVGRAFRGVEGAFNVALCKISNARRDLLDDDYLFHIIPSKFVKGELLKRSERSLIPSMSIEHLRELEIPLPPLLEQQRIVKTINALAAETQRLTRIYEQKLAALVALKKSLLHQAFSGEL